MSRPLLLLQPLEHKDTSPFPPPNKTHKSIDSRSPIHTLDTSTVLCWCRLPFLLTQRASYVVRLAAETTRWLLIIDRALGADVLSVLESSLTPLSRNCLLSAPLRLRCYQTSTIPDSNRPPSVLTAALLFAPRRLRRSVCYPLSRTSDSPHGLFSIAERVTCPVLAKLATQVPL